MEKGLVLIGISLLAAFWGFQAEAQTILTPRLAAQGNLENLIKGPEATVEAGGGLSLKISPMEGGFRQDMLVLDKGKKWQR